MMIKRILSSFIAMTMLLAAVSGISVFPAAAASDSEVAVRLDPADASPFNGGEFQGWGTSLGWWGNRIGYNDTLAQSAADLFYSEDGLSLDIVRYNVGGGDHPDHNHVTRSDSKLPCFAVPELNEDKTAKKDADGNYIYTYNWDNDKNQVNVLKRIKARNSNVHIEGYTNSPPWFMTISQCSGGGPNAGDENLAPENYGAFAGFLADVAKHFEGEGLKFDSYSPMNEPNPATKYWTALNGKQEGNLVAPGEHQSGIINAVSEAFDKAGVDTMVVGLDETSIDYSITSYNSLNDTAKANLDRLDTHTYSGSKRAQLKQTAIDAGKTLWMSEVDHGGTAGTNAGNMGMALDLANLILNDMNGMQPAAWVMWDILDFHKDSEFYYQKDKSDEKHYYEKDNALNQSGGLWGVGMVNHDTKKIELTQKYYGYGQFTKYIEPGMTIIASSSNTLAAYDKKTGKIVVVGVNFSNADQPVRFDLRAFTKTGSKVQPIRTSGAFDGGEHWAELDKIDVKDKQFETSLKANSITTYVIEPEEEAPVEYMTISGSGTIVAGMEYSYSAKRGSEDAAVAWKVSDDEIASVTENGVVTAKKGGEFTLTATAEDGAYTAIDIKALDADQTVRIVNKKSGLGLETRGKGVASGTSLVQWSDRQLDTAAWKLAGTENGHFTITNKNAGMLLVSDQSQSLVIKDSAELTENDGIEWDIINHGGYYEIKNVATDKSLDVSGQSTSNGGSVILYTYGGGDNELWSFEETAAELTHVVPVVIDYSAKYAGTDYVYVNNVESATNDFNDADLKDFVVSGFAGLGSDGDGESVLLPQNSLANSSNRQRAGSATLELTEPVTASEGQLINFAFDMYPAHSSGTSTFILSSSDGSELVKILATSYGEKYSLAIGGKTVESDGDGKTYFKNSYSGNDPYIKNGGHVEVYYRPSDGYAEVTIKNLTNSAAPKTYTAAAGAGKNIGKIYFAGDYTAWNKQMAVDNLVTNIVKYADGVTPPSLPAEEEPKPIETPTLPDDGALISLNFDNADLTSSSDYGKATGNVGFVNQDGRNCAQFNGTGDTVIKLTDANGNPLLTGQKNLTISFKVKPTVTATSWWFYAAPNDSSQTANQEKYLGAFTNGGTIKVERYNNSGSRSAASVGTLTTNEWNDVVIYVRDTSTSVYVNGSKKAETNSSVDIADMLGDGSVLYIGKANWGNGEYATGYLDDFAIYNYAPPVLDAERMGDRVTYTTGYSENAPYDVYTAIYDSNGILKGVSIDKAKGEFTVTADGEYTITQYVWKGMEPVMEPESKVLKENNNGAYLFVHFIGDESNPNMEQIYYSVSTDGSTWKTVNGGSPILTSSVGEKGVRDPFILRGEDGKFFLIATDLSIYYLGQTQGSNKWGYCQTNGSKSIVVWESDDLVNWSSPNLVEVAVDNAGCTWAPEAVYDSEKDAYMVFWASKVSDDNYSKQRMYRSYTKDFKTFTAPEVYIENADSAIDTTILKEGDTYYRFTKDETHSAVTMMKSKSLSEGWEDVSTYTINGVAGNTVTGYEGPTIYKLNGEDKWCLLLDHFSGNKGYEPFVTEDIAKGAFTSAGNFNFDAKYRHGTVMPITADEYNAIVDKYGK